MKPQRKKVTLKTLGEKIARGEKIIGMECHDTPSAMMGEELGMDLLCVGSPGPMALFGHKSMNTVEFQEQLYFLEAVLRGGLHTVHLLQYAQHHGLCFQSRCRP